MECALHVLAKAVGAVASTHLLLGVVLLTRPDINIC